MKFKDFLESFDELFNAGGSYRLTPASKILILSDLHMGDGGPKDDLETNRSLLMGALRDYYLEQGYALALNGDIEELQKFRLKDIFKAWRDLYGLFGRFDKEAGLFKIVGNHDLGLIKERDYPFPLHHALNLAWGLNSLFLFHGHQASSFFARHNYLSDFMVRYLAGPLRIKNTGVLEDLGQRYKTERRIYRASRDRGVVSVIGHTHRPLFESRSKYDSLRLSVESLVAEYPSADPARKEKISELVHIYRREFERLGRKGKDRARGLYQDGGFLVPALFNSGCATGRKGFTALEVTGGMIRLVHWARAGKTRDYLEREALERERLEGGTYARYLLESEHLESLFSRVRLLGPDLEEEVAC